MVHYEARCQREDELNLSLAKDYGGVVSIQSVIILGGIPPSWTTSYGEWLQFTLGEQAESPTGRAALRACTVTFMTVTAIPHRVS